MANPLVSIVMPNYNGAAFVAESIESVLRQTMQDWELLVVDDASTDSSEETISSFSTQDPRVVLICNKTNLGAAKSRNVAITKARGRFIAFLDSDDLWMPDKLGRQVDFMLQNCYPFTYTGYQRIDPDGRLLGSAFDVPLKVSRSELLKGCVIGCLTSVYDTNYFGKSYLPDIRRAQDWALWLDLLRKVDFAYAIPETLAFYRVGHVSLSSNKWRKAFYTWKVFREHAQLSRSQAAKCMCFYAVHGIKKWI